MSRNPAPPSAGPASAGWIGKEKGMVQCSQPFGLANGAHLIIERIRSKQHCTTVEHIEVTLRELWCDFQFLSAHSRHVIEAFTGVQAYSQGVLGLWSW